MLNFIFQYSRPDVNDVAISNWIEHLTEIQADTIEKAKQKFYKKMGLAGGTYYLMDCWQK